MSQEFSIIVPAQSGKTAGKNVAYVSGRVFFCISATDDFKFRPDNRSKISGATGKTYGSPRATTFSHITFFNSSDAAITVNAYVGDEEYNSSDVPVVTQAGLTNDIAACKSASPQQFLKTSSSPGTPVALTAQETFFRSATVLAQKSEDGSAAAKDNAGNVYLGVKNAAGKQPYVLSPGDQIVLPNPTGSKVDFRSWFLDVQTSGDGIVVIYT
jgi:hypothetical protein